MKNKISIILLCIICVICCCVSVFGDGLLQQIYVDLEPINIVIDGEEKNPPADMQPMIYNDRTYVPLRYVAESLGKDVDWEDATRTVFIGEHEPMQTEIFESFTGPVSKNWEMSGEIQADGPNGYLMNDGSVLLHNFLPDKECNFTVEFEVYLVDKAYEVLDVYLGTDIDNKHIKPIRLTESKIAYQNTSCNFEFCDEKYHTVRFDVDDEQCVLYIDDEYIHTFNLEKMVKPALCFDGYYSILRNVNVKLND